MSCSFFHLGNLRGLFFTLVAGCVILIADRSYTQTTLNVANFGARGDAVQFFANTTSNSTLITTTIQVPSSAIGDAIEVFGVGQQTYGVNSYGTNGYGNQDLIATIANVVNGTNIYISQPAQKTLTNAFATYGHDNRTNFQNCLAAATGTNTTINIPAGTYLILCPSNGALSGVPAGVVLKGGGLNFVGAGADATTLLSQGAWTLGAPPGFNRGVMRGFLFVISNPVTNNYPVGFYNMTLDGGLQHGNTSIHGVYPNPVDGLGWDTSSDALDLRGSGSTFSLVTMSNVVCRHWRGEMLKSNDLSTNGVALIENCVFRDGNATAINYYPTLTISNCLFQNLFQVAEYYQAYSTGPCYFVENTITNITGNMFAINGGIGYNPPFFFKSNIVWLSSGANGFMTTPGDNVYITGNKFQALTNHNVAIALGVPGYQSPNDSDNSNIVVAFNTFSNIYSPFIISGGAKNRSEAVTISSNLIVNGDIPCHNAYVVFGWATNVQFSFNSFKDTNGNVALLHSAQAFRSGNGGSPLLLVETNNTYWTSTYSGRPGKTNYLSYANGSRFQINSIYYAGGAWALVETNAGQIPAGAQMLIYNNNSSGSNVPIYLNSALTRFGTNLPYGQTFIASWTNGAWVTQVQTPSRPESPTGLRVVSSGP